MYTIKSVMVCMVVIGKGSTNGCALHITVGTINNFLDDQLQICFSMFQLKGLAIDRNNVILNKVSFKGGGGGGGGAWNLFPPPLEIVLLKFIIDIDKCLTKCMSSESMHM